VQPPVSVLPLPQVSPVVSSNFFSAFALLENERLYLNPPNEPFDSNFLPEIRHEQALMQHLGALSMSGVYGIPSMLPQRIGSQTPVVVDDRVVDARPTTTDENHARLLKDIPAHGRTNIDVAPDGAAKPRKIIIEPDNEAPSPFGDVIRSVHEIHVARNEGRYTAQPRERSASERSYSARGVDLHPALTFKLYVNTQRTTQQSPRPAPPAVQPNSRNNRFQRSRPVPAAANTVETKPATDDVFHIMPPAAKLLQDCIGNFLQREADLPSGATIVAAVSGGVDSLAMLDALVYLARTRQYAVVVVHLNHQLRAKASDADANFVRDAAKRYGIPCYIAEADVERFASIEGMSIETAARELRYKFLEFVAYKRSADAVATAHTLNDSVETVLMNLLRGSGLTGLSGIPAQRAFGNHTKLIRPILMLTKDDVLQYAAARELLWREDASNALPMYTRNKVRNELLPLLEREYSPRVVQVLHRTARLLQGADEFVQEAVERVSKLVILPNDLQFQIGQPFVGIRIAEMQVQGRFLQSEIVRRAVQQKFGISLGFDAVENVLRLLGADIGAKATISRNFIAFRDRSAILITPTPAINDLKVRVTKGNRYDFGGWTVFLDEIPRRDVKFTADPTIEFLDSDLLPYRMTLRTWRPGDAFKPLGMKGTMNVSDYLTNSKIPLFNRQNVLVMTATNPENKRGEDVIWLCGMRLNNDYKVMPNTKHVLRVEFRRPKGHIVMANEPEDTPGNGAAH
jgi:tRNA(Ile)-lysidine synthase